MCKMSSEPLHEDLLLALEWLRFLAKKGTNRVRIGTKVYRKRSGFSDRTAKRYFALLEEAGQIEREPTWYHRYRGRIVGCREYYILNQSPARKPPPQATAPHRARTLGLLEGRLIDLCQKLGKVPSQTVAAEALGCHRNTIAKVYRKLRIDKKFVLKEKTLVLQHRSPFGVPNYYSEGEDEFHDPEVHEDDRRAADAILRPWLAELHGRIESDEIARALRQQDLERHAAVTQQALNEVIPSRR